MKWENSQPSDRENLRVLVNELRTVVDLVVNHHKKVLFGVVLRNILIRVLLLGHFDFSFGRGEMGDEVGEDLFGETAKYRLLRGSGYGLELDRQQRAVLALVLFFREKSWLLHVCRRYRL